MDKLARAVNKVKIWHQKNKIDLAVISIIVLMVLLAIGVWRLGYVKPPKIPITIEGIE